MELTGSRFVPATPAHTWEKLISPETLKVCIAGCDAVERLSPHEYRVKLHAPGGRGTTHVDGMLRLSNIEAPYRGRFRFEGDGGPNGPIRWHADITLRPEGRGARLAYTAHVDLAESATDKQARRLDRIVHRMADNFFSLFSVCAGVSVQPRRPLAPTWQASPAYGQIAALANRLSWLGVAGVAAAIAAYYIYLR